MRNIPVICATKVGIVFEITVQESQQ